MKNMTVGFVLGALIVAGSIGCTAKDASQPQPRHLIYLHGWIIQDQQDLRPEHPRFGFYEMEEILETFRDQGFTVSGEIRPKSVTVEEAADHVVAQVQELLEAGVPAQRITVLGASMGAGIALVAAEKLENPDLRFAVLGTCLLTSVKLQRERGGKGASGRILAIREASDQLTASCTDLETGGELPASLHAKEIVLNTGLNHGFLYTPLPEWVQPVLEWATAKE